MFQRIDFQDRLRRLQKNPLEEDAKQIEQLRGSINAEFGELETLQRAISDILATSVIIQDIQRTSPHLMT
jgi:hypothetical protein